MPRWLIFAVVIGLVVYLVYRQPWLIFAALAGAFGYVSYKSRQVRAMKSKYAEEIRQWEAEGYDVSEFKEKWLE